MSKMLSLLEAGIDTAAKLARAGKPKAALELMNVLVAWPNLSHGETLRTLRVAVRLAKTHDRFRQARNYLRMAMVLDPQDATLAYELGCAFESDPFGCDRKAARSFRKATRLNTNEPHFRAALGRALIRINELDAGIRVLCKAAAAALTRHDVLEVMLEGLREAGRADLAFKLLCKSRFLAPADRHIQQLWNRAKYDLARQDQRRHSEPDHGSHTIRPMLKLVRDVPAEPRAARRDTSSRPVSHINRLRAYRADLG